MYIPNEETAADREFLWASDIVGVSNRGFAEFLELNDRENGKDNLQMRRENHFVWKAISRVPLREDCYL